MYLWYTTRYTKQQFHNKSNRWSLSIIDNSHRPIPTRRNSMVEPCRVGRCELATTRRHHRAVEARRPSLSRHASAVLRSSSRTVPANIRRRSRDRAPAWALADRTRCCCWRSTGGGRDGEAAAAAAAEARRRTRTRCQRCRRRHASCTPCRRRRRTAAGTARDAHLPPASRADTATTTGGYRT